MSQISMLIIEDDKATSQILNAHFESKGMLTKVARNGGEALAAAEKDQYDISLLDLVLPDMKGLDLLKKLKEIRPFHQVIVLTGVSKIDSAVQAIKAGAYDYITKPCDLEKLSHVIQKAYEANLYIRRKKAFESTSMPEDFIAESSRMKKILQLIPNAAATVSTVLISGESGTGKELVAREIHRLSERSQEPFVVINCSAIPESLFESELFGHEKGAFTSALERKIGLFEIANKGTVFLDEISEMPHSMQVKLLRVLQFKEFRRVGSNTTMKTDIKIITATNKDIQKLVQEGSFREDLFYRIHVLDIHIPPL
ncbi:MAG: sigma-54-dependent Fis family transcriptional regulator, partial [Candidatus Aureabacteria bacterium]|nr:sigma-54-dependent Fis family transcriptional regulator [Candidatus Auribacterota bacterium]